MKYKVGVLAVIASLLFVNWFWPSAQTKAIVKTEKAVHSAAEKAELWYHKAMGVDAARSQYGLTGEGITIAVIDSGIAKEVKGLSEKVVASYDFSEGSNKDSDGHPILHSDHGTMVTSTIVSDEVGIAPGAEIIEFNISKSNGKISTKGAFRAYEKIIELLDSGVKIDIVQMSFGRSTAYEEERSLLKEIATRGVILVAASGNLGLEPKEKQISYPAAYDEVIAVGSVDSTKARAEHSSTGNYLDVVAPGVDIEVVTAAGVTETHFGTSYAAPLVSGVLALYKEAYPAASADILVQMLYENAEDVGDKGADEDHGIGLVSAVPPEEYDLSSTLVGEAIQFLQ